MSIPQATIERGVDLWVEIARLLNEEIQAKGQITINNKRIWDGWLHRVNNDDWQAILLAFGILDKQTPGAIDMNQYRKFDEVLTAFDEYCDLHPRCMDIKSKSINTKIKAWGMIMVLREVYNKANDLWIPNQ